MYGCFVVANCLDFMCLVFITIHCHYDVMFACLLPEARITSYWNNYSVTPTRTRPSPHQQEQITTTSTTIAAMMTKETTITPTSINDWKVNQCSVAVMINELAIAATISFLWTNQRDHSSWWGFSSADLLRHYFDRYGGVKGSCSWNCDFRFRCWHCRCVCLLSFAVPFCVCVYLCDCCSLFFFYCCSCFSVCLFAGQLIRFWFCLFLVCSLWYLS